MALSRHSTTLYRPRTIDNIVREAQNFEFTHSRALKNWIRSAQMLLTEAAICEQDGNLETAYLYVFRHAHLVLSRLPHHPEYRDPRYKAELSQMQRTVQQNLAKLETWKPQIKAEHERFVRAVERRNAERATKMDGQREAGAAAFTRPDSGSDAAIRHALNASEDRQLAVDVARRELQRRSGNRKSSPRGASTLPLLRNRDGSVVEELPGGDGVREIGDMLHHSIRRLRPTGQSGTDESTSFRYPPVPSKAGVADSSRPPHAPLVGNLPPPIPAKRMHVTPDLPPAVPPRPDLQRHTPQPQHPRYIFEPSASTEAGAPLRPLLLPPDLRPKFLSLAHANTARNLETCAILCGTVIANGLFISHLILPDQTATSDTCDTTEAGDTALFDYCDAHALLVCGWIHTHPSQTCFLSSRDLHTSAGYQCMLPEAIAIVCAPRHVPDWGIFRLTDPPGLPHVLACTAPGIFHPHAVADLYTDALRPGHVVEGPGLEVEVVDLRGGGAGGN